MKKSLKKEKELSNLEIRKQDRPYYLNNTDGELFINPNISSLDKELLCRSLIMSSLRVDVAVLEQNLRLDMMTKLEELLTRMMNKVSDTPSKVCDAAT